MNGQLTLKELIKQEKMEYPKCPHCKYEFTSENIFYTGSTVFPTEKDGDFEDTYCLNCNEPLQIQLSLEPSWLFLDANGEEIS